MAAFVSRPFFPMSDLTLDNDERALLGEKSGEPAPLNPQDDYTRNKYFGIYEKMIVEGKTVGEVALEMKMSQDQVSRIKMWCQKELGNVETKDSVENLKYLLQKRRMFLNQLLDEEAYEIDEDGKKVAKQGRKIRNILAIMGAELKNSIVLAKVEGWLKENIVEGDKEIHVHMPQFMTQEKYTEVAGSLIDDSKPR
jgi:hypothetical protein